MKMLVLLIGFAMGACAGQAPDPPPRDREINVFLEEPLIEYESLGSVNISRSAEHEMEVLEKVLDRAAEMGADGVIVHSVRTKGRGAGGGDTFGTGGGGGFEVYQIQATAIRYIGEQGQTEND
jgi:hypothetical protein